MMYLTELIELNGDRLVKFNECRVGEKYVTVFNYSEMHGGTYDSFQFYNKYVVEIGTGEKK